MGAARPWSRTGSTPWSADRPSRGAERGCRAVEACRSGPLGRSRGADPRPTGTGAPFRSGSAAESEGRGPCAGRHPGTGRAARPTGGVGAAAGRREIPPPGGAGAGARATARGRPAAGRSDAAGTGSRAGGDRPRAPRHRQRVMRGPRTQPAGAGLPARTRQPRREAQLCGQSGARIPAD